MKTEIEMKHLLLLTIFLFSTLLVRGQSLQSQVQEYLKRNNVPHDYNKDSKKKDSKTGYFLTNKNGQTTLTLPKGAINLSVPTGDSAVYIKIASPKFANELNGALIISEYRNGKIVDEKPFGIGKIRGSLGIRVDAAIDNKDNSSLSLYFISGQIFNYPLEKQAGTCFYAVSLTKELESIEIGKPIHAWIIFEDNKKKQTKQELEQTIKQFDGKPLFTKIAQKIEHYYIISYQLNNL